MDYEKKGVKVFLELDQPDVKFIKALEQESSELDTFSSLFDRHLIEYSGLIIPRIWRWPQIFNKIVR